MAVDKSYFPYVAVGVIELSPAISTQHGQFSLTSLSGQATDKPDEIRNSAVLSIAIISRSVDNLRNVLRSVRASSTKEPIEVLVSWNGKAAPPYFADIEDRLAVHYYQIMPYNFARNNNALAKYANGDLILFLNDDVELDVDCLDRALREARKPEVGIVGANLRYADEQIQHAGVFFDEKSKPYHRFKHEIHYLDPRVGNDEFVPAVTGAFLLLRKLEFDAIRFDERFAVAGEDVVFCLEYRKKFRRGVLYCADARAVHYENVTRKQTEERSTPDADLNLIKQAVLGEVAGAPLTEVRRPRVRIVTEKPGWIMHRKALEIQTHMGKQYARINEDWDQAEIHYYINYGYLNKRPKSGVVVANFTHFDPDLHAEKFIESAFVVDHCISVSELTSLKLLELGVPETKITTIRVGADARFRPKLTLGISGRPYKGGRKGEDLLQAVLKDPYLAAHIRIVSMNPDWGVPVFTCEDPADFYRAIDYLLVTARIEGGPVPFMEALACGTLSIAPPIGVIPEFSHIPYETGSAESLLAVLRGLVFEKIETRDEIARPMFRQTWAGWSVRHEKAFRRLLSGSLLS